MSVSEQGRRARRPYALGRAGSGRRLAAAVAAERAGRGELAELVPDHVLLDEHPQELVAVVDLERVAHELRDDGAGPGPGPDRLLRPPVVQHGDLAVQLLVDVGALLRASAPESQRSLRLTAGGR